MRRFIRGTLAIVTASCLAGCAAGGAASAVGAVANLAMQAAGLGAGDRKGAETSIPVSIHGGSNLNADDSGSGVAAVARFYKLRSPSAFLSAPYDSFGEPAREKEALGDDLIETKEVVLTPESLFESRERMTAETTHLGIVVLFRSPAPGRWRFVFAKADAGDGIRLGAHACALTVTQGKPVGVDAAAAASLAPVSCAGEVALH